MVVIQLGSILAVPVLFWYKLWPFGKSKSPAEKKGTWVLWLKVLVGVLPVAVIGFLADDLIKEHIYQNNLVKCAVIAGALILYGIAFIVVERLFRARKNRVETLADLTYRDALLIGCFQVLSIIPGTSRSGSTILGGRLLRVSRTVAAEFSFFMAIPVMLGASLLDILKYFMKGYTVGGTEVAILLTGMVVAFLVSLLAIKFLMEFVRRHSFEPFGWYRIGLGAAVLIYMTVRYL
jgi:undecaprenyl-diphosphatase